MWYFVLVYFNWVFAAVIWGLNRWHKGRVRGFRFVAIGSTLELLALFIHWRDWRRLRGEPDQLYAWILPLLLSMVAVILVIIGVVRSFLKPIGAGSRVANDPDIA